MRIPLPFSNKVLEVRLRPREKPLFTRAYYHTLLDAALDETCEGDFFICNLTGRLMSELRDRNNMLQEEIKSLR